MVLEVVRKSRHKANLAKVDCLKHFANFRGVWKHLNMTGIAALTLAGVMTTGPEWQKIMKKGDDCIKPEMVSGFNRRTVIALPSQSNEWPRASV